MRISVRIWPWFLLVFGVTIFSLDIVFKGFIHKYVDVYPVFSWGWLELYLQCVTNRGMAWGMFHTFPRCIFLLRLSIVIGLLTYYFRCRHERNMAFCILFILVGAFGNIFDFLYYGYVIDMFHFVFWGHSYGIFNFSDFCIFVGAIGLLVCSIRNDYKRAATIADKSSE